MDPAATKTRTDALDPLVAMLDTISPAVATIGLANGWVLSRPTTTPM